MDLQELKDTFAFFDDWEDKYRFVIDLGKELEDMPAADKLEDNLVRGCQSQVWLTHEVNADGSLHFTLDSDAFIVRGLISIVLSAFNNKQPRDIAEFDIEGLFDELDLMSHLSATRGNGLRSMIEKIRQTAKSHL